MKGLVMFGAMLPVLVVLGSIWIFAISVLYVREELLA